MDKARVLWRIIDLVRSTNENWALDEKHDRISFQVQATKPPRKVAVCLKHAEEYLHAKIRSFVIVNRTST